MKTAIGVILIIWCITELMDRWEANYQTKAERRERSEFKKQLRGKTRKKS